MVESNGASINAIERLATLGDNRAIEPLLRLLGDEHYRYTERALNSLKATKMQMSNGYLSVLTTSKDAKILGNAINQLLDLGDNRAIEPLLRLLQHDVYPIAEEGLKRFKANREQMFNAYVAALSSPDNSRSNAINQLVAAGDKGAIEPLLRMLGENYYPEAEMALAQLRTTSEQLFSGYINALSSNSKDGRQNAIKQLTASGDKRAIEPLLARLDDEDYNVRWDLYRALNELQANKEEMINGYFKALSSINIDVCEHAAARLGEMDDHRALEPLLVMLGKYGYQAGIEATLAKLGASQEQMFSAYVTALSSDNVHGRKYAVAQLQNMGDKHAIKPLLGMLGEDYYSAVEMALKTLGATKVQICKGYVLALSLWKGDIINPNCLDAKAREFGASKEQMVNGYIAALSSSSSKVRGFAACQLGCFGDNRAIKPLLGLLTSRNGTMAEHESVEKALKLLGCQLHA